MKKILSALVSMAIAWAMFTPVSAVQIEEPIGSAEGPSVISENTAAESGRYTFEINGEELPVDACIMVPLRQIAEALGFTVTWNNGTVLVDNGVMHTTVTVGEDLYTAVTSVDGLVGMSAPFSLGAAPYVVDGTTYVPLELFPVLLGNQADAITFADNKIKLRTESAGVQIPNPFMTCASLSEAEQIADFSMAAPEAAGGLPCWEIRAISGEMIEILYQQAGNTVSIRKGVGTGDISGDYQVYAQQAAAVVDGRQVEMKGNGGQIYLATWTEGGYTFAVRADAGMSRGEMEALIQEIA